MEGKEKTHHIYDKIIESKENQADENNEPVTSILSLWLERKKTVNEHETKLYSYEQLRHLLADLFGAGVDTTLTTLRWFLLYMAKYKNIQESIREVSMNKILLWHFDRLSLWVKLAFPRNFISYIN